ncbi:MAG TPA: DUF427 domain-containing protein [Acidimicrobiia bacterium]|nr:DUF427 domain-containing protein [Acidimicrobiia bacterium]
MRRDEPGPGQESVWDYPRPPRVERCLRRVRIVHAGIAIADSTRALRVLETSHPPGIYLPPADVRTDLLERTSTGTWCEFKGHADYWRLAADGAAVRDAAWSYPNPTAAFEEIRDHLSFYPGRVDACFLDDEPVIPQEGGFYGGWITGDIVGPFKGAPGTLGW